uniref:Uncharacterized protein n=1 Tax=Anopheles coluzzii TaxID=1518534 RepID=A0A8W7PQ95_ANOCL
MAVCLQFVAVIIRFPWFDIRSSFLFANLIVTIVVLGGLLATIEKHLPTAIRQTFRYDKHALKGSSVRLVSLLEILKAHTFTNKHSGFPGSSVNALFHGPVVDALEVHRID